MGVKEEWIIFTFSQRKVREWSVKLDLYIGRDSCKLPPALKFPYKANTTAFAIIYEVFPHAYWKLLQEFECCTTLFHVSMF